MTLKVHLLLRFRPVPVLLQLLLLSPSSNFATHPSSAANEDQADDPALLHNSPTCTRPVPLGMQSGALPDAWLSTSSSFHAQSLGPQNARIRTELGGGAWCPREQVQADSYEFVQVNFPVAHEILGVELQGRDAHGAGREWTEAVVIDFLKADGTNWTRYETEQGEQILAANRDTRTPVLIRLRPPLAGTIALRLVPFSLQLRTVCLRFELYGCAEAAKVIKDGTFEKASGSTFSTWSWGILLLLLFVLLLITLFFFLFCRRGSFSSSDQRGLFFSTGGSSSPSGSSPLRPSSSWQNVLPLSFDPSTAKVFSPSFCRFESVSLGWPSLRSPKATTKERCEEDERGAGGTCIARSRSLLAAACTISRPMQATTGSIPVRPVRSVQLAHSCSQPESFVAIARPLQRPKKPVPTPRKNPAIPESP